MNNSVASRVSWVWVLARSIHSAATPAAGQNSASPVSSSAVNRPR